MTTAAPAATMPAADTPALDRLRAATARLHRRLESRLDLARFADRPAYRALLAAQWGFHAPIEARLARFDWAGAGLDMGARWRRALLETDLAALDLAPAQIAALPRCAAMPDPPTRDAAFGCLYVIEGATLGGQVVLRRLRADGLAVGPGAGADFLAGRGRDIGAQWRGFRAALATCCADADAAAAMAAETFAALEAWLDSRGLLVPCTETPETIAA